MSTAPVHLAIFGDVHGHLRLMFQLCRLWQISHQTHLDGVLVCGDLGYYPDISRLDKATQKFAARDEEELGIGYFFLPPQPPRKDELLERTLRGDPESYETVRCPVVFCHGNHEDFELLERATSGSAFSSIDAFDRVFYLRSGETTELSGVRIGALGGAPEVDGENNWPILHKFVSGRGASRLARREIDVLLTHGAAEGSRSDEPGSALVRQVIDRCRPLYHVYGHHRRPSPPVRLGDGQTKSIWFNDVNFQATKGRLFHGPLEEGCMGVLTWRGPDDHELEIINQRWFREVTYHSWRSL